MGVSYSNMMAKFRLTPICQNKLSQPNSNTKRSWGDHIMQWNPPQPPPPPPHKLSLLLLLLLTAQLASRDLSVQVYSHTQSSVATLYYVFAAELYFFPDKRIFIFFVSELENIRGQNQMDNNYTACNFSKNLTGNHIVWKKTKSTTGSVRGKICAGPELPQLY